MHAQEASYVQTPTLAGSPRRSVYHHAWLGDLQHSHAPLALFIR
jgi:hypothetical protein